MIENKIASSGDIANLEICLQKFFYSPNVRIDVDTLQVSNANGPMVQVAIKPVKSRGKIKRYIAHFV